MLRKGGPMGRPFRAILALAAAPLVAGCVSGTTSSIDVNDSSTVIGTVRMSVDLGDRPGPRSRPHTSHAIELGLAPKSDDGSAVVFSRQAGCETGERV